MTQLASRSDHARKDAKQPFRGRHLRGCLLTGASSNKRTVHHEISLNGAEVAYRPGDVLGVRATNDPTLVDHILTMVGSSGDEPVEQLNLSVRQALLEHFNLTTPSRRLLEVMAERGAHELGRLLEPAHTHDLKHYLQGHAAHDVLDVLESHPHIQLTAQELVSTMRTLLPRLYSIASSLAAHPDQVDVLVVSVNFAKRGRVRHGVASSWLNDRWAEGASAEMYLQNQQTHFAMPTSPDTPMIMVGPGTGVAPFRSFLEERRCTGARGRNWLFFGEQHRATEFYYEAQFSEYERDGFLRLDTAFSRDQDHKVYVQHRMVEQGRDVWAWLEDGAELFICGDKTHMAADVDRALHEVIATHGSRTPDQAAAYVENLRATKRYKRDVY